MGANKGLGVGLPKPHTKPAKRAGFAVLGIVRAVVAAFVEWGPIVWGAAVLAALAKSQG